MSAASSRQKPIATAHNETAITVFCSSQLPPLSSSKSSPVPQSAHRKPETDASLSGVDLPLLPAASTRSNDNVEAQGSPAGDAAGDGPRRRHLGSETCTGREVQKHSVGSHFLVSVHGIIQCLWRPELRLGSLPVLRCCQAEFGTTVGASPIAGAVLWPEASQETAQGRGSAIQELQDDIERFRVANEELKRAVNDEREKYGATIRDIKLLCLTQDDADVAKTQLRLRQYYGLRYMLMEKLPSQATVTEADRLVLDQITTLNAELELALAERQAERHRQAARGGQLAKDNSRRDTLTKNVLKESQVHESCSLSTRLQDELLQAVTSLQQENQRLHEENVRIRRTLAGFGKKGK